MGILDSVKPVTYEGGSRGLYVGGEYIMPGMTSDIVNPYATAGRVAAGYQNAADGAMDASVGAAQGGVDAARKAASAANASVKNMNQFADEAAGAARGIGGSISDVKASAGKVSTLADSLSPYADQLNRYGGDLYNQGLSIYSHGGGYLNNANDILNLNAGAGGLAGEFVQMLNAISPDRYVSMASQDVRKSFEGSLAQLEQMLSRQGISPGSGRDVALRQQWAMAQAAATAGAKSRALQLGLNERLAALTGGFGVAQGLAATGSELSRPASCRGRRPTCGKPCRRSMCRSGAMTATRITAALADRCHLC